MRKKYTIADMQKLAEKRGGKCLSSEYVNTHIKLWWVCAEGHQWEATPGKIKQGRWCPKCGRDRTNQALEAKKLTIEDMQTIAKERGGKCLSSEYFDNRTKLKWECSAGHSPWEATPDNIKRGTWCPQCAGKQPGTIEEMRAIAEARGGKCLSSEYVNSDTKLQWECSEGHTWGAVPSSIKWGTWCPQCAGKNPTIEEFQTIAKKRGGKCLSSKYVNANTKLQWECSEGHTWETTPANIKKGAWCRKCGFISSAQKRKSTIEEMQAIAEARGGKCLSDEYVNNQIKLKWQCSAGHQWEATPGHIKQGQWCPKCGYISRAEKRKLTIEEMQAIAEERGGQCLSDEYVNANTKLQWECSEGHTWETTPGKIKQGQWCPKCRNLSERICREAFEQIFQTNFKTRKPQWLVNEEGNTMELDGYSPALKLAFEHQGAQHFEITYYTPTQEALNKRIRDDQKKIELCKKEGIILIVVDYLLGMFRQSDKRFPDHVKNYIGGLCKDEGVTLPENFDKLSLDLSKAYQLKKLAEMQKIAKARGGECLSKHYIASEIKLEFKCAKGHQWEAIPYNIKKGHWCSDCAGKRQGTIEEMKAIAKERGGQCLSSEYVSNKTKLKWECAKGHQWEAIPSSIKRGSWCLVCAGNLQSTIEEMQDIAKERGGKCLSFEYVNTHTKLQWECSESHQWKAVPSHIKQGQWCPKCAGKNPTIEEFQTIAKKRGGKCLSSEYVNAHTKLKWECSAGHQWEATPDKIKRGSWCPDCAGKRPGTIEEMQTIAEAKGGKCLSIDYVNAHTKLQWQCSAGHQWGAQPSNIKTGHWCPDCSGKRPGTIEEMRAIAGARGGQCLSDEYMSAHTKLKWECSEGHTWEATPSGIKGSEKRKGTWCPKCGDISSAQKRKGTIEEMQTIAEAKGGKCLSFKYMNAHAKLQWECTKGHQWFATPHSIKRGTWCPVCAGKRKPQPIPSPQQLTLF